jgi:hypothetical protein
VSLAAKFSNWETVLTVKCIFIAVRVIMVATATFFIGSAAVAQRPQADAPSVLTRPEIPTTLRPPEPSDNPAVLVKAANKAPEEVIEVSNRFLEAIFRGDQKAASEYLGPTARAGFERRFPEIRETVGMLGIFKPFSSSAVETSFAKPSDRKYIVNYNTMNLKKMWFIKVVVTVQKNDQLVVDFIDTISSIDLKKETTSLKTLSGEELREQARQRENMGAAIQFIGRNIALALATALFLALFFSLSNWLKRRAS